ncbi:hypothetical protein [Schaalia cardiffensis]|uniref:hypothetical protein n=1 Tax=Schaalia cardiffensis TaxID=181487 RepID=UPI0023F4CE52|nr:hypothetical protein [Schaalia cardiffensis]
MHDDPNPPAFDLIEAPTTDPDFDAFWDTYPRRVGKDAARKAWRKAIKRAKPAEIIAGAARYRDDPNRVEEYTKHPGPWLNAGRWADDPLPPRAGARPAGSSTDDRVRSWLDLAASSTPPSDPRKEITA